MPKEESKLAQCYKATARTGNEEQPKKDLDTVSLAKSFAIHCSTKQSVCSRTITIKVQNYWGRVSLMRSKGFVFFMACAQRLERLPVHNQSSRHNCRIKHRVFLEYWGCPIEHPRRSLGILPQPQIIILLCSSSPELYRTIAQSMQTVNLNNLY